jgi:hypothetical protein
MKCQIRRKNDLLKRHFMQSRSFLLRNKFLPFISNCVIFWAIFLTNHSTENRSSVNSDRSKYFFSTLITAKHLRQMFTVGFKNRRDDSARKQLYFLLLFCRFHSASTLYHCHFYLLIQQ